MRSSYSAIQTFKQCRKLYQIKYIYGFEPIQTAGALERGLTYHEGIENILKSCISGVSFHAEKDFENPKVSAMIQAFENHIIPKLEANNVKVVDVEKWFNYTTESGHVVLGRMDGVTDNGVIEHKTTSSLIDGAYLQKLDFDEQIPTYMIANGCNKILYTVCSTPSIRQKKEESNEEFYSRCVDWYSDNTFSKINVFELVRSEDELKQFAQEQDLILCEMERTKLFYRNPSHCNKWGRMCEFAPICKECNPNSDYIGFKRRERNDDKIGQIEERVVTT